MHANAGDWILKGIDGEQWSVKREIFNKTYDILNGEKCKYCSVPEIDVGENIYDSRKDNNLSIVFDAEDAEINVKNIATGEMSFFNIKYCPFCDRKL